MGRTSGSGKVNDKSELKPPRKASGGSGDGSGSSGTERAESVCLISFRVELTQSALLKSGLALSLKGAQVIFAGSIVGTLTPKQHLMVERCKGQGFGYRGTIEKGGREKLYYGIFKRFKA